MQNQMVDLQSQPVLEDSKPLTQNEICETVLGKWLGYSKGLGWGPKPKSRTTASSFSSSIYDYQAHIAEVSDLKEQHLRRRSEIDKLRAKHDKAKRWRRYSRRWVVHREARDHLDTHFSIFNLFNFPYVIFHMWYSNNTCRDVLGPTVGEIFCDMATSCVAKDIPNGSFATLLSTSCAASL